MPRNSKEKSRREQLEEAKEKTSQAFWGRKEKLSLYMTSLPFALASVAVASFPYPRNEWLVLVEVLAWLFLIGSGAAGLIAKHAESEIFRRSSLIIAVKIEKESQGNMIPHGKTHEEKKIKSENLEEQATKIQKYLLCGGVQLWLASRILIAVLTPLGFPAL